MPNNVTNRLEIIASKDQLKAIFEKYNEHQPAHLREAHDKSIICNGPSTSVGWFHKESGIFKRRNEPDVYGLPEGWDFEITHARDFFPSFEKVIPPPDCDEYKDIPSQQAVRDHTNWWRTWNVKNWGTKWGGYSYSKEGDNIFFFETAWSHSALVIARMSESFPDVEFIYEWADEDFGYNVGRMVFKKGIPTEQTIPKGGTKEAFDIALKLDPSQAEHYTLVNGTYEYNDEQE